MLISTRSVKASAFKVFFICSLVFSAISGFAQYVVETSLFKNEKWRGGYKCGNMGKTQRPYIYNLYHPRQDDFFYRTVHVGPM